MGAFCDEAEVFLSTPSGWRATNTNTTLQQWFSISIHALRVEGDGFFCEKPERLHISIHALRVEGDGDCAIANS